MMISVTDCHGIWNVKRRMVVFVDRLFS